MNRRRTSLLLGALVAAAFAVAGCGVPDPYEPATDRTPAASKAGTTPEATLRRAALLDGNWTSASVPDDYRQLAALSSGDARERFEQVATGARSDGQPSTKPYAKATVTAVVVHGSGLVRHGVVVTRQWFASGEMAHLPPEYNVTLATVALRGDRWVITTWRPQQ